MTALRTLQDMFQRAILEKNDGVLSKIPDSPKENREVLLGVYQNAYVIRLVDFLQNDYEKLNIYLGDEQFDALARAYIAATPSHNPNGRWFGSRLPEFLYQTPPYNTRGEIGELADLERALNDVFDAVDATPLALEDLAQVAPEEWGNLTFSPHPATRTLEFETNTAEIWSAIHREENPPQACHLETKTAVLVYREQLISKFRQLSYEEAMAWKEASKGLSFAGICEMLSTYGGEEEASLRAAGYLQQWIQSGLLLKP